MFLLGYFVARRVQICLYIFTLIYPPLTEICCGSGARFVTFNCRSYAVVQCKPGLAHY